MICYELFCSLFIIAAPGMSEVYSNISSMQWFLNIFTMLFTLLLLFRYEEYQKQSKKKKYLYAFFCSASFLSSAFSIVFLPALIYVIIREIRKNSREIFTIINVCNTNKFSIITNINSIHKLFPTIQVSHSSI